MKLITYLAALAIVAVIASAPARAVPPVDVDAIRTHVEFFGYATQLDEDQLIATHPDRLNLQFRQVGGGVLVVSYVTLHKELVRANRAEFLEVLNTLNLNAVAVRLYVDADLDVAIEAWYPGGYERDRFGLLISGFDTFHDELLANDAAMRFFE